MRLAGAGAGEAEGLEGDFDARPGDMFVLRSGRMIENRKFVMVNGFSWCCSCRKMAAWADLVDLVEFWITFVRGQDRILDDATRQDKVLLDLQYIYGGRYSTI